jgi:transposase-like protein
MILKTLGIAGNQRYSWMIQLDKEPAIAVRESDATTQPAPQNIQLMSKTPRSQLQAVTST